MLRNQLSAAVKNAAENLGYAFYEGFGYRMNEKVSISRQLGGRLLKSVPYMDEMKAS